jgi:hypothetical protein
VVVDPCPVGACEDPDIALRGAVTLDDVDGRFDVLLASAILEHIPEVGDTFVRLVGLGAPGAVLYARTPWWVPLMRVIPNVDMTFPAHVHDMGPAFWNRVNETYGVGLIPVASRPSLVETTLTESPLRTVMAYALKAPSLVEVAVRPTGWTRAWWKFVGGWEAVFAFPDFDEAP